MVQQCVYLLILFAVVNTISSRSSTWIFNIKEDFFGTKLDVVIAFGWLSLEIFLTEKVTLENYLHLK